MPAAGDKVFVTGASGYIGSSVVYAFLNKGYHVRTSVRNQKRADKIFRQFAQHKDKLEVVFADLTQEGAFDSLLQGVVAVIHTAAQLPDPAHPSFDDYFNPDVKGTISILEAALKVPSIKRVIFTSTGGSVISVSENDPNHVYNENDWNPLTVEQARSIDNFFLSYLASKTAAEKAAFDFVAKHKSHFDIVTILPGWVFGPTQQAIDSAEDFTSTYRAFYQHVSGDFKKPLDSISACVNVDIREVAQAHVAALENPKAANQRYLIVEGPFQWQEIPEYARKHFPKDFPHATTELPATPIPLPLVRFDGSKAVRELGIKYRSKEETFADTLKQIIEFHKAGKVAL